MHSGCRRSGSKKNEAVKEPADSKSSFNLQKDDTNKKIYNIEVDGDHSLNDMLADRYNT